MKRNAVAWAALVVSVAALVGSRTVSRPLPAAQEVPEEGQKVAKALSDAFGAVADFVAPSVVQINVEKKLRLGRGGDGRMPRGFPDGQPMPKELEEMLKKFFGGELPKNSPFEKEQFVDTGTGSGFVLDDKGHILTNAHVVDGTDKILVTFHEGAQVQGKVVGVNKETDVAVIKVEAPSSEYHAVKLGDSDDLRVGQWVLALGSPFGLDHTVTAGIISATQRQEVGINRFEQFIQTDAAINPGNSGGPLVDLSGRVVGINSAIATASRSNSGVGFAIPINMAVRIAEKLIKDGKVAPALMGISIDPLTSVLARQLGLPPKTKGVVVTEVGKGTPAEKAGLKVGDVIVSYDGQEVSNRQSLQYLVTTSDIGKSYRIVYLRDGAKEETSVAPAAADTVASRMERVRPSGEGHEELPAERAELVEFGLAASPLSEELAKKYQWKETDDGLVVTGLVEDGPAQQSGIEVGDRITRVIRDKKIQPIASLDDLRKAAEKTDELSVYVEDVNKRLPGEFKTLKRAELDPDKPKPTFVVPGTERDESK
jgi:serine protease Do